MDSGDDSEDELMSKDMLEDSRDSSQSHPRVNSRQARYKIHGCIKQRQSESKGALLSTQNMGKYLHKVFKAIMKEIWQDLPNMGESGSEVSFFIPEPRNFSEVTIFLDDIKKPWIKATQKKIKNLINNQTFISQDPEKVEPVTPCVDVYKDKIQFGGSLDKFKLRIVIIGDL